MHKLTNKLPLRDCPLTFLGLVFEYTFDRINLTWLTNYGLNNELSIWSSLCKSFSAYVGLTITLQSLSWKKCFNNLLILFLFSIASDVPFWNSNAFYKYYLGVIGF